MLVVFLLILDGIQLLLHFLYDGVDFADLLGVLGFGLIVIITENISFGLSDHQGLDDVPKISLELVFHKREG